MTEAVKILEFSVLKPLNLAISDIIPDLECEDYFGFNFKINNINFKFRKSKLTPKKTGQFVTLWKRDSAGRTVPFDSEDQFEFYIIAIEENNQNGFFIFPKTILEKHQILTTKTKEGKRGFRVYSDWHITENKQADKTKKWQTQFFINCSDPENLILEKFQQILDFQ